MRRVLLKILFRFAGIFSPPYALVMRLRAWLYQRGILLKTHSMPVPVISVGNLSMGGTGKTPLVIYLAGLLREYGYSPAVLSRGYGRKQMPLNVKPPRISLGGGEHAAPLSHSTHNSSGNQLNQADEAFGEKQPDMPVAGGLVESRDRRVLVVSDGMTMLDAPEFSGDEPALIAASSPGVPVLVSASRVLAARQALALCGVDSLVLDDAYQHLAIARDMNLMLFSASALPFSARVFPGGVLREPWSALSRADAAVISGVNEENSDQLVLFKEFLREKAPELPVFTGGLLAASLVEAQSGRTIPLDKYRQQPVYAFAGIARPESFRQTVKRERFVLSGFSAFPDHYRYQPRDLDQLVALARQRHAKALLTTEKDLVKLRGAVAGLEGIPLLALRVALFMEKSFDQYIKSRLADWVPRG